MNPSAPMVLSAVGLPLCRPPVCADVPAKEPSEKAKKSTSRTIPKSIKEQTLRQTNGKCAYTHCTNAIDDTHHTIPFAEKPHHKDLVGLCKIHHELCHNGVIKNRLKDPQNWRMQLIPDRTVQDELYLKYRRESITPIT